jgi:hypothetical protein
MSQPLREAVAPEDEQGDEADAGFVASSGRALTTASVPSTIAAR